MLLDPETQRAAAYTNNHRLVVELASKKLIEFALANTERTASFDTVLHAAGAPEWRPLPSWMDAAVKERLLLLWIRRPDGESPDDAWLGIPKR